MSFVKIRPMESDFEIKAAYPNDIVRLMYSIIFIIGIS
jgi:hypothetical protein